MSIFSLCAGVDENAITEILARRTNAQRQEIKAAFQQDSGKVRPSRTRTADYL